MSERETGTHVEWRVQAQLKREAGEPEPPWVTWNVEGGEKRGREAYETVVANRGSYDLLVRHRLVRRTVTYSDEVIAES